MKKFYHFLKKSSGINRDKIRLEKVTIGNNTLYNQLSIQYRKVNENKIAVSLGSDSIINGSIIFEKETGKIDIGSKTFLGGTTLICINSIKIGNDVMIAWGTTLMDNDAHSMIWEERMHDVIDWKKGIDENCLGKYKKWANVKSAPITIENKVWIGFNSIILKGVTIGEGAVIGAGSVVTKDIPPFTLAAGNPAVFIKSLNK